MFRAMVIGLGRGAGGGEVLGSDDGFLRSSKQALSSKATGSPSPVVVVGGPGRVDRASRSPWCGIREQGGVVQNLLYNFLEDLLYSNPGLRAAKK